MKVYSNSDSIGISRWLALFVLLGCVGCGLFPDYYRPPVTCQNDTDCPGSQLCVQSKCFMPAEERQCRTGQTRTCYTGPENTKGVGICKEGTQSCQPNGSWGTCAGQVVPADKEICGNGLDDDCNGKADLEDPACGECTPGNQRPCYTGPPDTEGIGVCKAGTQTCDDNAAIGARWGECKGQVLPTKEDCDNGLDDNCNGKVDQDDPECGECRPGTKRPCYTGPPKTEGKGICKAGTQTCQGSRSWGECEGDVHPAAREICGNGKDDNCNEKTDNEDAACPPTCNLEKGCSGGLFCYRNAGKDQGFCLKPCIESDASACPENYACARPSTGQPTYCLPLGEKNTCNPDKMVGCPPDQFCNTNYVCEKAKIVDEEKFCDRYESRCNQNEHNRICAFMPLRGVCLRECQTDQNCPSTYFCKPWTDPYESKTVNVCVRPCIEHSDCFGGLLCQIIPHINQTEKFCAPGGVLPYWDVCQYGGSNCLSGARCLIHPDAIPKRPIGYCIPDNCSELGNKCPDHSDIEPSTVSCSDTSPTGLPGYSCLIPCRENAAICSKLKGFSCQQFSSKTPPYCSP